MIYSPLSFFPRSSEKPLALGALITATGQALVYKMENGRQVVAPSAGTSGEIFAGFVLAQTSAAPVMPSTAPKVETIVAPGSGTIVVGKTPLAGSVSATRVDTGAAVAVASVTGKNVALGVGAAGLTIKVVYRYALTIAEARSLVGDVQPGGYSGNSFGITGVAHQGIIYTSEFDTSLNFAAATSLKLGAGGLVEDQTGDGAAFDAVVVQVPTTDYPFLGIQFNSL